MEAETQKEYANHGEDALLTPTPPPTSSVNQETEKESKQRLQSSPEDTSTLPTVPGSHPCEDGAPMPTMDDSKEQPKTKAKFTYHQKITFLSASLATFANMMAFSIISVFFPVEAKAKGMSQTVIGLVFAAYAFASGIGSPVWGKILPRVGARFMFLAGIFVTGGCNILFAFIIDMPSPATFTAFCFIIRILEGLGSSAGLTASSAIVAYVFPDNVGTAVSVIEMIAGVSYATGPAIGGLIYNAGGFKLPFFVLGGVVLVIDGLNFFLMPEQGSKSEKTGSMTQVLSIPAIWVALIAAIIGATAVAFLDPTLSLHLKQLDFTVIETSLMFMSLGLVYAVTSILWGYLADKKKCTRIMIVMGAFGSGVFFLLLGPSPLLKIPPTKLVAILDIPLLACSVALVCMPTLVDMFSSTEWYGVPSGLGLTGVISGLLNSAFAFGTMLGPLLGGVLTDQFGFSYAATFVGGSFIVAMIFICLFGVWEYQCGKGRRQPRQRLVEANSTDEERTALLSDNS